MTRRAAAACLAVWLAMPALLGAQEAPVADHGPRMASRAQLEALLDSLQATGATAASEHDLRARSDRMAAIRHRLENGDVHPGDVVALAVVGQDQWTDSFTVTPQRNLELPNLNEPVSLEGVLYSEVEETIARELARYLREPRVRADVLKRVAVLGGVGRPGFYHVQGSFLVSDVLMTAGGPAGSAKVKKLRIRRDGERLAEDVPQVAFQNLSLDELGVRSGDEIFVPQGGFSNKLRLSLGVLGAATSIFFLATRF